MGFPVEVEAPAEAAADGKRGLEGLPLGPVGCPLYVACCCPPQGPILEGKKEGKKLVSGKMKVEKKIK